MVDIEEHRVAKKTSDEYLIKKCPLCFAYLPLHTKVCTYCQSKVGPVDKLGFARKPFDWKAYLLAVLSIAAFVIFVWWAFFRE